MAGVGDSGGVSATQQEQPSEENDEDVMLWDTPEVPLPGDLFKASAKNLRCTYTLPSTRNNACTLAKLGCKLSVCLKCARSQQPQSRLSAPRRNA